MKFDRVWVPCTEWEEITSNFWGDSRFVEHDIKTAVAFMKDTKAFGSAMDDVICDWPNSTLNALTDQQQNRQAWLGQAAVCIRFGIPEYITRKAWKELSLHEQDLANLEAKRVIKHWEFCYAKSIGLSVDLGKSLL